MLYTNAHVFTPSGFIKGGFEVEDGRFAGVFEDDRAGGVDLGGAVVIPGLVDIHTHGAAGADFSALRRATARALSDTSTAVTSASGNDFLSAMAMQPLPVPTSRMRKASGQRSASAERTHSQRASVSGRGMSTPGST